MACNSYECSPEELNQIWADRRGSWHIHWREISHCSPQALESTYAVATTFPSSRFREDFFDVGSSSFSIFAPRRSSLEARELDFGLSSRRFGHGTFRGPGTRDVASPVVTGGAEFRAVHVVHESVLAEEFRCCFSGTTGSG